MRVLQVIEPAYRATLEEQDDTVLWFTRAMRSAGAPADALLCGSAVNYAVIAQDAGGFQVGAWRQAHPPAIAGELAKLIESGARVVAVEEDLKERGIAKEGLVAGVELLGRKSLAGLFGQYARVWKW
ncbi:MAG TPA: DsrE family protein [Steroidobacteraceae bacterium]|nr:DsrE family protein [Steroidobacteraceae bacterium]